MNGARTTYMRKGYLLTALAAAVLLAASSGTAWAQSIGFETTSGSVMETAFVERGSVSSKHAPLEIKVRVSGLLPVGDPNRGDAIGSVTLAQTSGSGGVLSVYRRVPTTGGVPQSPVLILGVDGDAGEPDDLNFAAAFDTTDEITLLVAPNPSMPVRDDDWVDDDVVITLSTDGEGVVSSPNQVVVTIVEEDVAPVVQFDRADVLLTEDSDTSVVIDVESGSRAERIPAGLATAAFSDLRLSVSNPAIVSVDMACETDPKKSAYGSKALSISAMRTNDAGVEETDPQVLVYDSVGGTITFTGTSAGDLAGAVPDEDGDRENDGGGIKLMLQACGDNDFRDMDIALAFVASRLRSSTLGNVTAGDPAMISIRSIAPPVFLDTD